MKRALFLLFWGLYGALQAQFLEPDRSVMTAQRINNGEGVRTAACGRGLSVMEVYYILTEYRLLDRFPLAGLFYDVQYDSYTVWSLEINPNAYFRCDSLALQALLTDGDGIWLEMEVYAGLLDPPMNEDGFWQRPCKRIGIYLPHSDLPDGLKKIKRSQVFVMECGETSPSLPAKAVTTKGSRWIDIEEGLGLLRDSFPAETRKLEMTNFNLRSANLVPSLEASSEMMLELLYCGSPSKLHHIYQDGDRRHDGYIVRYFFQSRRWTVTHVKDTVTGWQISEGYIDPQTGRVIEGRH